MKRAQSLTLPVPVDGELKSLIEEAAAKTRLSQADVMRSGLRIGVPEVVRRMKARAAGKLFNLEPWDPKELARACGNKRVDRDYPIEGLIGAQSLPKD